MEFKLTRKAIISCTLDASEAIMFSKGGRHQISMFPPDLSNFEELIVTFQVDENHESRARWIQSEAANHRAQWDEINKREADEKKGGA